MAVAKYCCQVCWVRNVINALHSIFQRLRLKRKQTTKSALLVKSCSEVFSRGKNSNSNARTHWSYSLCWYTASSFCPFLMSHQKTLAAGPSSFGGNWKYKDLIFTL